MNFSWGTSELFTIFAVIKDITENKYNLYKSHRSSIIEESKCISHRLINIFMSLCRVGRQKIVEMRGSRGGQGSGSLPEQSQWWPAYSGIWILSPTKNKKNVKVGPPLTKLSGSAHGRTSWSLIQPFIRFKHCNVEFCYCALGLQIKMHNLMLLFF